MTLYDYNQVRAFADKLNAQLDECENGEGTPCHTLDAALGFCADRCREFAEELRKWGRDVFSGRVAFDAVAEEQWKAELLRLNDRALKLLGMAIESDFDCYVLDGKKKLESSLFILGGLLPSSSGGWVTPKISVGPSARQEFSANADEAERIKSLPPLPLNWRASGGDAAPFVRAARHA